MRVGSEVVSLPAALPRGERPSTARRRDIRLAYLLLSPTLLLLLAVLAYPVGWEVWVSLTDLSPLKDGPPAFVGLKNYLRLFADAEFWWAGTVTVVYAAVTSAAKLIFGVAFALLLARPFRGRALVFLAIFLPWAYPGSVSFIGWYWTLSPPITTSYSVFMGNIKYAKALKQTLKIKTFVGTSANALKVQVWTALIAMLLLRYLQLRARFAWSLSNLVALLRMNLFTHRDLWTWLDHPYAEPPPLWVPQQEVLALG